MRRALLLSLGMAVSSYAFLGDWKIWTPVQTARMAVLRSDNTIFAATTGGVLEWDPVISKGTMQTGLQGIPSLDIASIVADSSGNIWAVCSDGNLAFLAPGASTWQRVGSYATSGWTFSPGAAVYWKGYLVLGGPKGLTLFSTIPTDVDYLTAVDNISTFGAVRDTVTSVIAHNDTLWVSVPEGLAYATDPVWNTDTASKHIGKAGYYLSASRWTTVSTGVLAAYTLLRDSTGVHLGYNGQWRDLTHNLKIDFGTFTWGTGSLVLAGINHALPTSWGYFLSSTVQGVQLLTSDGTLHRLIPDGALPNNVPRSVAIGGDGSLFFSSMNPTATVWSRQSNGPWTGDTVRLKLPDAAGNTVTTTPWWDENETMGRYRRELAIGPRGEVVLLAFGGGPWSGDVRGTGVLVSTGKGNWSSWSTNADTCLNYLPHDVPDKFGVAAISASSDSSGTWISQMGDANSKPRIQFLPAGGSSHPTCLELHEGDLGPQDGLYIWDFVSAGRALWLATNIGLVRVPDPSPTYPPNVAQGISSSPDPSIAPTLLRVTKMNIGGSDWVVGAGVGVLGAHSLGGAKTDTFFMTTGLDQVYDALAVDALGQLWAAGDQGIDIYSASLDENGHPSFERIRRVGKNDGLPENHVVDLRLDPGSGKALIATAGALSLWTSPFRPSPARIAKSTIRVWPNPVRLRQNRTLFVDGATPTADFDLFAADGTLVMHQNHSKSSYGLFQIDLPRDMSKLRPGVYYWSLKDSKNSAHGPLLIGE